MPIQVVVTGADAAQQSLARAARGAASASGAAYLVGSGLVYAYGIETGRHRRGGLARRAGGARMLTRAVAAVRAAGSAGLVGLVRTAAARGVELDGRAIVHAVALKILGLTMPPTPVRTGTLRRSFHVRRVR